MAHENGLVLRTMAAATVAIGTVTAVIVAALPGSAAPLPPSPSSTAVAAVDLAADQDAGTPEPQLKVAGDQAAEAPEWTAWGQVERPARGQVYLGLRETERCHGGFQVEDSRGACSHGPDPAPAGVDVRDVPTVAELEAQEAATEAGTGDGTAAETTGVPCYGDGVSGKRVQVIYAVASDRTDRYASVVDLIRGYAYNLDQVFYRSAARDGGVRHVRFVTEQPCRVDVDRVVLSPTGDDSIANTRTELRNLGYTSDDRKYVVFADANRYCGISYVTGDDRPDASNPANSGATVSRVDSACWGGTASVPAHELAHGIGAVQLSAPNSNGAWHCTDEYDRLCYNDGSGATMTYLCASSQEPLLDCNGDDYFNVAPAAGSWLATRWNLANSAFLEAAEPAPTPSSTPTASPTPTTSPTPTSSPTPTTTPTTSPPTTSPPTTSPPPTSPTPTSSPTPTTTPTPSPTPTRTKKPRPRKVTTLEGRVDRDGTDTYRLRLARGDVRVVLVKARSKVTVTVRDSDGDKVLSRRGAARFAAATDVRRGAYRVLVTGKPGLRYTVRLVS